jgi:hypothetical protein
MRKDIPRKLYKYFGPERSSFFNDLRVRFSQLGSFNDPFEGRPEISSFAKSEDILRRLGNVTREDSSSVYQSLPFHIKSTITAGQVHALAEHLVKTKGAEIRAQIESVTPHAAAFITGEIDRRLGVLCLSEVPDSLLMWAHYGSSHTGFVVEFDAWHSCFHQKLSTEDDLRHLRRVQYRETRPSAPLAEMEATDLFLAKSGHWDYEREWRIVRPLDDSIATIPSDPYPINLFEMPADAIQSVIFGTRIRDDVEKCIRTAIESSEQLGHVRMMRSAPSASHFLLEIHDD